MQTILDLMALSSKSSLVIFFSVFMIAKSLSESKLSVSDNTTKSDALSIWILLWRWPWWALSTVMLSFRSAIVVIYLTKLEANYIIWMSTIVSGWLHSVIIEKIKTAHIMLIKCLMSNTLSQFHILYCCCSILHRVFSDNPDCKSREPRWVLHMVHDLHNISGSCSHQLWPLLLTLYQNLKNITQCGWEFFDALSWALRPAHWLICYSVYLLNWFVVITKTHCFSATKIILDNIDWAFNELITSSQIILENDQYLFAGYSSFSPFPKQDNFKLKIQKNIESTFATICGAYITC